MIKQRVVGALRLSGMTVSQLCRVLCCADSTVRIAVADLESRGTVRSARQVRTRSGHYARVWEIARERAA